MTYNSCVWWDVKPYSINQSEINLLGGTILPRFLFQKWYVSSVAC